MKGLFIIICIIISIYLINALKLDIQNKNVNNYRILKDFPIKENDFFTFQYTFKGASSDLNEYHDMVFAVHRKDKPVENVILISGNNSEVMYNNNLVYMRLHNFVKSGSSLTLNLAFNDFTNGMELSIYYLKKGDIDNFKNFIVNADRFQPNKILTKSIKIQKMKNSEYPSIDAINNYYFHTLLAFAC